MLFTLSLTRNAWASGPPDVYITTTEAGVSYRLYDWNRRLEKKAKTLEEVSAWSSERVKEHAGEFVGINADDGTSFKTIMDLLRRLKAAGVKHFVVTSTERQGGDEWGHTFQVRAETIDSRPMASSGGMATPSAK